MAWPVEWQVPAAPLAISASSAGDYMSGVPAGVSVALASALESDLGCAATRADIASSAIATRENVCIGMLLCKNGRTILKREIEARYWSVFRCNGGVAAKAATRCADLVEPAVTSRVS